MTPGRMIVDDLDRGGIDPIHGRQQHPVEARPTAQSSPAGDTSHSSTGAPPDYTAVHRRAACSNRAWETRRKRLESPGLCACPPDLEQSPGVCGLNEAIHEGTSHKHRR